MTQKPTGASTDLAGVIFEEYPDPTFIVDRQARVLVANRAARALLGDVSGAPALLGHAGDVFDCVHAREPGGCGYQESCQACVVRSSVEQAFTGGVVRRALAIVHVHRAGSDARVSVHVSAFAIHHGGDRRVVVTLEDVSDLVRLKGEVSQAEQALRESEALYRSLFTLAPSGVVLLGEEGRILAFNDQAHQQLGYTRQEFGSLRLADLHSEEQRPVVEEKMAQILGTGDEKFECRHRTKSGETRDVLFTARRVEIGGRRRLLSVWEDITDRTRAEQELRASEARFRAIFEQAAVGVVQVEMPTGRYVRANDKFCAIVGYTREEVLARRWQDFTHPDDLEEGLASVHLMAATREPYSKQKRYVRKDGSVVWVDLTVSPMWAAGEKPTFQIAVIEDVTAHKLAELALNRSEARFRALIEKATDVIVVLDGGGRIRFWSPGATKALGWTAKEALARASEEFVHPEDRQRVADAFAAAAAGGGSTPPVTIRCGHKDGSWRLLEGVGRNLLGDSVVRGVVVNARDVTEQCRLEEQFQQAQKLESIGRLAGGVAHDFNNLLTVILSGVEAMKQDMRQGLVPDAEIVQEVGAAGERARDLTRQLLAFARRQVIAPVPLDLGVLVRSSEKLLRRVMGEDVELVVALEPGAWPVRCDPGQIEQVVLNLAVNARDAMPRGGVLTLETRNVEVKEGATPTDSGIRPGSYARLSIRDSGEGMSPEVKAHVFEPFFTTKPVGQGTGLGLATVYGIVRQNNGYVLVDSSPGRGTTFELYFPRTSEPVVAASPVPAVTVTCGAETVLVVEDDPQVRAVTVRSLLGAGYRVLMAGGGAEALELAARERRPIDILVTDVIMPGLDGRAVADELRRHHPELRVLYVSGHAEEVIANRGVLEPGTEFLPKPFTKVSLLARVRAVLDAR